MWSEDPLHAVVYALGCLAGRSLLLTSSPSPHPAPPSHYGMDVPQASSMVFVTWGPVLMVNLSPLTIPLVSGGLGICHPASSSHRQPQPCHSPPGSDGTAGRRDLHSGAVHRVGGGLAEGRVPEPA